MSKYYEDYQRKPKKQTAKAKQTRPRKKSAIDPAPPRRKKPAPRPKSKSPRAGQPAPRGRQTVSRRRKPAARARRYAAPKKPTRRRSGCLGRLLGVLLRLTAILLALVLLFGGILWAIPVAMFAIEPAHAQLSLTDNLPSDRLNVLLLGVDALNHNSQRSDTMMILSIGYDGVRIASVMRDTEVEIPGHGKQKLNAAYAYGGAELTMRVINEQFGMNIMHYVATDFLTMVRVVDALGGVTVNVTQKEMEQMNKVFDEPSELFTKAGYTKSPLKTYGDGTHLNGLQTLVYSRIRKGDSDYQRTGRQRDVLKALLRQVKRNPLGAVAGVSVALSSLDTNMNIVELLSVGIKALLGGDMRTMRLPVDGTFKDDGSKLILNDANANRRELFMFCYSA